MSEGKRQIYTNVPDEKPKKRKRRKKKRGWFVRSILFFFKTLGTLILIGLTTGALLACFGAVYIKTVIMPQTDLDLSSFFLDENSVMYYQNSAGQTEELVTVLNTTSSIWKDYDELPQNLLKATVAIEDQRFWTHPGVDWKRTAAAVLYMFTGQDIQGGSTLTQQLLKNITTYDDVTVKRKIIEIFRALELENNYTKEEILTWYLNVIYLGEGNEGVGAASLEYFGKDVSELTMAESASLISITNNPSIYSPYSTLITTDSVTGQPLNGRERNKERQELVLWCMQDQGLITYSEYQLALREELQFVRSMEEEEDSVVYTWYEEQVIKDVRADLMEEYGYSLNTANMLISKGGLSIYTLMDPHVQGIADSIYQNWDSLPVTSANGQRLQSAITIIDNRTGDLVALVGQMGTKDQNLLQNFATESSRQPGSSFKPLSAYAPALEMGLISPTSVFDDYPYSLEGGKAWPANAYLFYYGMITIDTALMHSSNAAAVRVVGDLLTPQGSYDFVTNKFHIPLVDSIEYAGQYKSDIAIAPLALGGLTFGVNTRDMAQAYATFPNDGVYTHSRTYSKVLNRDGEVILDNSQDREQILSETTAYYINDLLQGVIASGTGTAARMSNMTIAGKTGTTNDNYDRWFVGYSPYYTAAVWTGYEYNEEIVVSGNPALNMWKKVMEPLHEGLENQSFTTPGGLTSVSYCLDSGMKPNQYCSSDVRGSRVASALALAAHGPGEVCTVHGADSSQSVCVDAPILEEDGEPSGAYYAAGPYCPSESIRSRTYVMLPRVIIGSATARDSAYVYRGGLGGTTCPVHTQAGEVEPEEPEDLLDPDGEQDPDLPETGIPGLTPPSPEPEIPDVPESDTSGSGIPGVGPTIPDTTEPEPSVPEEPETTTPTVPSVPGGDGIPGVG